MQTYLTLDRVFRGSVGVEQLQGPVGLSLIHISEPTRRRGISYAVFCLKKKKRKSYAVYCLKKKKIKKKKKNIFFFFFLMIRRPPRSTPLYSSAASDVYKRQSGPRPARRRHLRDRWAACRRQAGQPGPLLRRRKFLMRC